MVAGYLIYGVVTSLVLASKGGTLLYQVKTLQSLHTRHLN